MTSIVLAAALGYTSESQEIPADQKLAFPEQHYLPLEATNCFYHGIRTLNMPD